MPILLPFPRSRIVDTVFFVDGGNRNRTPCLMSPPSMHFSIAARPFRALAPSSDTLTSRTTFSSP